MTLKEAAAIRRSRRNFTNEEIEKEKLLKIFDTLLYINTNSGLNCEFIKEGASAFKKLHISYGFFKNINNLIVLKSEKDLPNGEELAGYFGELLVLTATTLGLSTCWIGVMFDKKEKCLNIAETEKAYCVIAVGYSDDLSVKEKLIHKITHFSKPKKLLEGENPPEWAIEGEKIANLAPTAKNRKGVKFVWDGEKLTAHDTANAPLSLADLGIMKFHFELGANGRFEWGNGARFIKHPDTTK